MYGLISLACTQAVEIHLLHVFGLHALGCEGAQSAVETNIDLVLDQRFGDFEVVALDQFRNQFVFGFAFGGVFLLGFHAFADSFSDVVEISEFSQLFRELVIQFRQGLLLNGFYSDGVDECLAGEALIGEVLRIRHIESAFIARRDASQVFGELGHGAFAADLDQDVVHVYGVRSGRARCC